MTLEHNIYQSDIVNYMLTSELTVYMCPLYFIISLRERIITVIYRKTENTG